MQVLECARLQATRRREQIQPDPFDLCSDITTRSSVRLRICNLEQDGR